MKLNEEEIKECIEYAEGFEHVPGIGLCYKGDDGDNYDIFLQRTIEGINKEGTYELVMRRDSMHVYKGEIRLNLFPNFRRDPDLTKENVIRWVLDRERV